MKNQTNYSFNGGIRFITIALAVFFAVLAVFDVFDSEGGSSNKLELVSEKGYDLEVFHSSITRPTSSKLTKIERMEVVKIIDRIFSSQLLNPQNGFLTRTRKILIPSVVSAFSEFDILANAP